MGDGAKSDVWIRIKQIIIKHTAGHFCKTNNKHLKKSFEYILNILERTQKDPSYTSSPDWLITPTLDSMHIFWKPHSWCPVHYLQTVSSMYIHQLTLLLCQRSLTVPGKRQQKKCASSRWEHPTLVPIPCAESCSLAFLFVHVNSAESGLLTFVRVSKSTADIWSFFLLNFIIIIFWKGSSSAVLDITLMFFTSELSTQSAGERWTRETHKQGRAGWC